MIENVRDTWATPPDLMAAINRHWPVDLDVCADAGNAKASDFYSVNADGLSRPWSNPGYAFCNPPGSQVVKWVMKALAEQDRGARIVLLVQAGIETAWFRRLMDRSMPLILSPRPQFIPPPGIPKSSNARNYILCIMEPWMVELGGAPMRQWKWRGKAAQQEIAP